MPALRARIALASSFALRVMSCAIFVASPGSVVYSVVMPSRSRLTRMSLLCVLSSEEPVEETVAHSSRSL